MAQRRKGVGAALDAVDLGQNNGFLPHKDKPVTQPAFVPQGVIPAIVLPFHDDFSIDTQAFAHHVQDVGATPGISALTINAHSTEVGSCTFDEQREVLAIARAHTDLPLVNGIYAEGSLEAARLARMATEGGANALLVFPPGPFTMGHRPAMVIDHYRRIADASGLPIICFQYSTASPQSYPWETLQALCDAVPQVRAIKDWIANPQTHQQQITRLQQRPQPVHVLTTHSAWLYPSLAMGCHGLLSGSGSVIATLQAQLFAAVQAQDAATARALHARITATADVFYAPPWVDMHNRMKEALVMQGRLPRAVVRPPLVKIEEAERQRIRQAMVQAGLLPQRLAA